MANTVKDHWKVAAKKTRYLKDPWEDLGFENIPETLVTRHVYNPRKKSWWKDSIMIKMEAKPFAKGAMRECYRMKKLSKFSHQPDWSNASNYVAKRYMQEQPRSVYEADVQLQMDSKLWGERYSKENPPKKVDFCQAYLIERGTDSNDSEDKPVVYCVEHFIEGEYIKYNSNSGFVSDLNRLTPQSFSHFTFEDSGHQSIVVDIQGVGDLYTDPQMHTVDLEEYGDANLGTRGMALFFSSHLCSPLCAALGLTQFDLSPLEVERLKSQEWRVTTSSKTVVADNDNLNGDGGLRPPNNTGRNESICEAFQRIELTLDLSKCTINEPSPLIESPLITPNQPHPLISISDMDLDDDEEHNGTLEPSDIDEAKGRVYAKRGSRSASVVKEVQLLQDMMAVKQKLEMLGQVHYELCQYHLIGRFTDSNPDLESAMFHLQKAGDCGSSKALYLLGCIHQQLPHQQMEELKVEDNPTNKFLGFNYFLKAAECGVQVAMAIVAQAFETGNNLSPPDTSDCGINPKVQDWNEAVSWYIQASETELISELDEFAPEHHGYSLIAKVAHLYETGGFGLDVDYQKAGDYYQQAGELATESMKGKLASKYFMSAEECWGQVPE